MSAEVKPGLVAARQPQDLISQAIEKGASVETLERLFALAKEVRAEQARAAWHEAMAGFQAGVPSIPKTKTARVRTQSGGEYAYSYAPLEEILASIRPGLTTQGLSISWKMEVGEKAVTAECRCLHVGGHYEAASLKVPVDTAAKMNAAQQVAAASTYARRYSLMFVLGLCPEDDDDAQTVETPAKEIPQPQPKGKAAPAPPAQELEVDRKSVTGRLLSVDERAWGDKPYYVLVVGTRDGEEIKITTFSDTDGPAAKAIIGKDVGVDYYLDKKNRPKLLSCEEIPF